jgi:hypothetical protein
LQNDVARILRALAIFIAEHRAGGYSPSARSCLGLYPARASFHILLLSTQNNLGVDLRNKTTRCLFFFGATASKIDCQKPTHFFPSKCCAPSFSFRPPAIAANWFHLSVFSKFFVLSFPSSWQMRPIRNMVRPSETLLTAADILTITSSVRL